MSANNNNLRATPKELVLFAAYYNELRHQWTSRFNPVGFAVAAGLLFLVFGIEYELLRSIFAYGAIGQNPSTQIINAGLMGFASMVAVLAWHVFEEKYPKSILARGMPRVVGVACLLLILGVGIQFSAVAESMGISNLTENIQQDNFNFKDATLAASQQTETPWLKAFLVFVHDNGKFLFNLGLCAFSLLACFMASHLIGVIKKALADYREFGIPAKQAKAAWQKILEVEKNLDTYEGRLRFIDQSMTSAPSRIAVNTAAMVEEQTQFLLHLKAKTLALPKVDTKAGEILDSEENKDLRQLDISLLDREIEKNKKLVGGQIENALKAAVATMALCLIFIPIPGWSSDLSIGVDKSSSSPILEKTFANLAAVSVANEISAMPMLSKVTLRTLGDGSIGNIGKFEAVLSPRAHPSSVAKQVGQLIFNAHNEAPQHETHILDFLTSTPFDCKGGEKVILISDGIEQSQDFSGNIFSTKNKKKLALPPPKPNVLAGCDVRFYGLGLTAKGSLSVQEKDTLDALWADWFKIAGATYQAIRNP